jgi:hypothetical protein
MKNFENNQVNSIKNELLIHEHKQTEKNKPNNNKDKHDTDDCGDDDDDDDDEPKDTFGSFLANFKIKLKHLVTNVNILAKKLLILYTKL